MGDEQVLFNFISVFDEEFTEEKSDEWYDLLLDAYEDVYDSFERIKDPTSPISFFISPSLVHETVVDAVIGLRKITDSKNNGVKEPNAFKVAAYLAYWWLRHKPVMVTHPKEYVIEMTELSESAKEGKNNDEIDTSKRTFHWKLKHINELVAVQFVSSYIFQFDVAVCQQAQETNVKEKQGNKFSYSCFDDMKEEMLGKLLYYFSYRAIAPKVIEQILEAYTFHPAWSLTGNLRHGDD